MKHTPIPRRVRTKRPSPLPGVLLMIIVGGALIWAQADDRRASERDRAALRQLARAAAQPECWPLIERPADQAKSSTGK